MNFEDMTQEERTIWRSGQGVFVRGFSENHCLSDLSKDGWRYAKKVYANDAAMRAKKIRVAYDKRQRIENL